MRNGGGPAKNRFPDRKRGRRPRTDERSPCRHHCEDGKKGSLEIDIDGPITEGTEAQSFQRGDEIFCQKYLIVFFLCVSRVSVVNLLLASGRARGRQGSLRPLRAGDHRPQRRYARSGRGVESMKAPGRPNGSGYRG